MHIDLASLIVAVIIVYIILQVLRRASAMVVNMVLFILLLAILMPYETRSLVSGLAGLIVELLHRLMYVFSGAFSPGR